VSCVNEIVDPAHSGRDNMPFGPSRSTGLPVDPLPITPINDDETLAFMLGLFAPPKSILKRPTSDSDIIWPAIQAECLLQHYRLSGTEQG